MNYVHIGFAVVDLDAAMEEMSGRLGLSWRPPIEGPLELVAEDGTVSTVRMRAVYSAGGPPAIELLEAVPGTIFVPNGSAFHHIGYWSNSLAGESAVLDAQDWPLAAAGGDPSGRPARFAQRRTVFGLYVELVDRWFDRPWLADLLP